MPKFRLNKRPQNPKKRLEVHQESCQFYHQLNYFVELGEFVFCSTATLRARDLGYKNVDGCKECCEPCHVG